MRYDDADTRPSGIEILQNLPEPVLIVSSDVGRGIRSLGEGLRRALFPRQRTIHQTIEELAGGGLAREDRDRYRLLLEDLPGLFHSEPLLRLNYWRKNLRERSWLRTELGPLARRVRQSGAASLVCVSHRPTFWLGWLRHRHRIHLPLISIAADFHPSPGWLHRPPATPDAFCFEGQSTDWRNVFPGTIPIHDLKLVPRRNLESPAGPGTEIMICGGAWGLGDLDQVAGGLAERIPDRAIHLCCGDNRVLWQRAMQRHGSQPGIQIHGPLPDLTAIQQRAGIVITKPGCATLVEARSAGQKIFLLPPLHGVEAGNARYAKRTMGAEDYSAEAVERYLRRTQGTEEEERGTRGKARTTDPQQLPLH